MANNNLCLPAQIYLLVSVITIVFIILGIDRNKKDELPHDTIFHLLISLLIKIVVISLWVTLLNWLCKNNQSTIAWIILLFPWLFVGLIFAIMGSAMSVFHCHAGVCQRRGRPFVVGERGEARRVRPRHRA